MEYIDALTRATEAAVKFADACGLATAAVDDLQGAVDGFTTAAMTANLESAASATEAVRNAAAGAAGAENDLADATYRTTRSLVAEGRLLEQVAHAADDAALAKGFAGKAETDLAGASALAAAALKLEDSALAEAAAESAKAAAASDAAAAATGSAADAGSVFDEILARQNFLLDVNGVNYLKAAAATKQYIKDGTAANSAAGVFAQVIRRQSFLLNENGVNYLKAAADMKSMIGEVRNAWQTADAFNAVLQDLRGTVLTVASAGSFRGFGNLVHWVLAFGAEVAAVAVPAMVAFGAAAAVALQGVQNLQGHLMALYTATEATANVLHQTVGSALGLGSALQKAQNMANPVVYTLLGSALTILNGTVTGTRTQFSGLATVGMDVLRIMQTFAAKVVVDFQNGMGAEVQGVLRNMIQYLVEFGQIVGNLGHAILNLAGKMPGLAQLLLNIADAASRVVLWFSSLPGPLVTTVMIMEEIWRWGPLVGSVFMGIGRAIAALMTLGIPVLLRLGEVARTVLIGVLVEGVGTALVTFGTTIASLGARLGSAIIEMNLFGDASAAVAAKVMAAGIATGEASTGMALSMANLVKSITPLQAALGTLVVAGLAYYIYETVFAADATQKLAASMQQADATAGSDVFTVLANQMATLAARQQQVASGIKGFASLYFGYGAAVAHAMGTSAASMNNLQVTAAKATGSLATLASGGAAVGSVFLGQVASVHELNGALAQTQKNMVTAAGDVSYLSKAFGTTWAGALTLGAQAGINWTAGIGKMSAAAEINYVKVMNLESAYKLMGQGTGVLGTDMMAIGIQSQLAATKIDTLNQAMSAFMTNLTGGTNALATFEQGLKNIGQVSTSTAGTLYQATGNIGLSTAQVAKSLKSFTGTGAQTWQNFDNVVSSSAQNLINWLNTAGAEGMVAGPQIQGAIKGIVLQLLPLASHSAAARSELYGLLTQAGYHGPQSFRALSRAAHNGGMSLRQLEHLISGTTVKMSNMEQVASNLQAVMNSKLVGAFDQARLNASHLTPDLNALNNALHGGAASAHLIHPAMVKVITDLGGLHTTVPTITGLLRSLGISIDRNQVAAILASAHIRTLGDSAQTSSGKMDAAARAARALDRWIALLHSKTIDINTVFTSTYVVSPGGRRVHRPTMPGAGGSGSGGTASTHTSGVLGGGAHPSVTAPPGAGGGGGLHPSLVAALAGVGGGGGGDIVTHVHVPLPTPEEQQRGVQTYTLRRARRNGANNLSLPAGRY